LESSIGLVKSLPKVKTVRLIMARGLSAGSVLLALPMIPFSWNIFITARSKTAYTNLKDPRGYGRSLEWATESPIPRHSFHSIPRVRSESPAFDLNYPEHASEDAKLANRRDQGK
jgi:cytochrome c oxidase subunit I